MKRNIKINGEVIAVRHRVGYTAPTETLLPTKGNINLVNMYLARQGRVERVGSIAPGVYVLLAPRRGVIEMSCMGEGLNLP